MICRLHFTGSSGVSLSGLLRVHTSNSGSPAETEKSRSEQEVLLEPHPKWPSQKTGQLESPRRCNINMWVSLEQFCMRERRCRGRGLTCCLQLPADTCKHLLVSRRDSYICLYSTCPVVSGRDSYICLYHICPGVPRGNLREPRLHTPGDVQQLPLSI